MCVDIDTDLHNSSILIKGAGNRIYIGKHGFLNGLDIVMEGNNNTIWIGDNSFVLDDTRLYVVDGSSLRFGNHCMLSDRIEIRTTDNHAIIDTKSGLRINMEEDVIIGDDVWIGTGVTVLKGSEIPNGCIIGAKSVITRKHKNENSIIVGNPGREIRNNVTWTMKR